MSMGRFRGGLSLSQSVSPALSLPILDLTQAGKQAGNLAGHNGIDHLRGLGGAGFSVQKKIESGEQTTIDTLVINAAECEPLMACDQALIREASPDIIRGIQQLQHHTGVARAMIGVESHRTTELKQLKDACRYAQGISVHTIEPRYPTGSEALLIRVLTGRQVPVNGLPRDCGVLCFNIATAHAFGQWKINGRPQTDRIVTVTGDAIAQPRNVRATFGTPIIDVIQAVQHSLNTQTLTDCDITVGGPLTGRLLQGTDERITAKTNCLIVKRKSSPVHSRRCIRCGQCNDVCPVNLLPQQLHWYAREADSTQENLQRFHLTQCIECGCCDVVCPSLIPLTHQFRAAKLTLHEAAEKQARADLAAQRFDAREQRLARRAAEKAARIAARKAELGKTKRSGSTRHNAIQDAIERAKASRPKKRMSDSNVNNPKDGAA